MNFFFFFEVFVACLGTKGSGVDILIAVILVASVFFSFVTNFCGE